MKSTVLRKDIAKLFAFGGDPEPKDPPRIQNVPEFREPKRRSKDDDDDDEDDDDDDITNAKDRRIRKLSRESSRRRIKNRELQDIIDGLKEENTNLRGELAKAEKLQKSYDGLKAKRDQEQADIKRMAILNAIQAEAADSDSPRAWYDVSMVQSLLNNDELAVDTSDFSVGGLKEQLDKIATEKPFLVKEVSNDQGNQNTRTPSGSAPQSSATGNGRQQQQSSESEMQTMFPALQNVV